MHAVCHCEETNEASMLVKPDITSHEDVTKSLGINISVSLCSAPYSSSVGSALPRRRCCAYITIGMICIFIGVGLTVSTAFVCFFEGSHVAEGGL